jgi:diadenosine tetraphosphatase ApaH/serine/threonine PP2A family protein phosphatase
MGNHDYSVLYEPTNFNPTAEAAAFWTRAQFDLEPDATKRAERYDFLNHLKLRVVECIGESGAMPLPAGGTDGLIPLLAVHGSPRKPINEYIFAEDATNAPDKLAGLFDRVERICVVGHTHVPGVFTDEPDFYPPNELGDNGYRFTQGEKAIINVGSVGQPRDGDPRASYAILHPTHVEFVRVPYDITLTAKKMEAIAELRGYLVDRLFAGK